MLYMNPATTTTTTRDAIGHGYSTMTTTPALPAMGPDRMAAKAAAAARRTLLAHALYAAGITC